MPKRPEQVDARRPNLSGDRRPFDFPAGWRIIIPGWPQLHWRQPERGCVFLATFLMCLVALQFAWGTWVGWLLFGFAFLTHVTSVLDAIRQSSFPVYPRRMAWVVTSGALGIGFYAPALMVFATTAWPCYLHDEIHSGYLINCWAYRDTPPRQGHWVWLSLPPAGQARAALVLAAPGQEVEWDGHHWKIDGRECQVHSQSLVSSWPESYSFKVPDDQILVEPDEDDHGAVPASTVDPTPTAHMLLVPSEGVIGRAWAQFYPAWERHLL